MAGSQFLDMLRDKILQPRLDALILYGEDYVAQNFEELSIRMAWYMTVNYYRDSTGKTDLDVAGSAGEQYKSFEKAIRGFCENKKNVKFAEGVAAKFGYYWGLLRKGLNIEAKGRAVLFGVSGNNILVVDDNRNQYLDDGLFLVICEKEKVALKWKDAMEARGFNRHFNIMVTAGFSTCEVIETLMILKEQCENDSTCFHVGILHDHDIAGHMILQDVKRYFPCVDLGINFEMLDAIGPDTWESLKENTKVTPEQVIMMANFGLKDLADKLGSFRLELDNLFVSKGIEVFIDYALQVIGQFSPVDLNRVATPKVSNPEDYYTLKGEVEALWDRLFQKLFGCSPYDIEWTAPAEDTRLQMIEENRHYEPGNIDGLRDYQDYISEQSQKLQDIIESNPENIARLEKIRQAVDALMASVDL